MSEELPGVAAAPGIVVGSVRFITAPVTDLGPSDPPGDRDAEIAAAREALAEVQTQLEKKAAAASNKEVADILSSQALIAADPVLADKITTAIDGGLAATHAVAEAFESFKNLLSQVGGYIAERVADLDDICARVLATLMGQPMPGLPQTTEPYVLVARDLAPANTAEIDPAVVLGLVTTEGGPTSHTSIIARSRGIPAVVSCRRAVEITDGDTVVVDGDLGVVIVSPDQALLDNVEERRAWQTELVESTKGPGRTSDGHSVALVANIGKADEVEKLSDDCEGVGLFRTEFLFLDRPDEPSIDEQEHLYRRVFETIGERKIIVRTLDAGADKPMRWLDLGDEANPALGFRGLRTSRIRPDVLENQLEAVNRAAKDSSADVWVMAPMVSTVSEAAGFVTVAHDYGLARAGVMVEVPSLAICADDVAKVVDFFSIGTNDLCQYVSASDRMIGELSDLLDHWQPALVRLIRTIVDGARSAGVPVGVCGESASDPLFALVLAGLGVTSLSMAPAGIPLVRASLRAHTIDDCKTLAETALSSTDARQARESVATGSRLPTFGGRRPARES